MIMNMKNINIEMNSLIFLIKALTSLNTGWIEFKVLTTSPLKFKDFEDKNWKSKITTFGNFVASLAQKLKILG